MWMLVNSKNGVSSWEIHRSIGVTQKTAWFMLQRARLALQDPQTGGKIGGEVPGGQVEVDETFIGGKARNMHKHVKARKLQGRRGGTQGKAIVAAVLERGGKVRARVIEQRKNKDLQSMVKENVHPGSALFSDALKSYEGLREVSFALSIRIAEFKFSKNIKVVLTALSSQFFQCRNSPAMEDQLIAQPRQWLSLCADAFVRKMLECLPREQVRSLERSEALISPSDPLKSPMMAP